MLHIVRTQLHSMPPNPQYPGGQDQPQQQQQQQQQNGPHVQAQQRTPGKPSRRRSLSSFLPRAKLQKDVESQQVVDASSDTAEAPLPFLQIPGPIALLGVAFLWGTYGPALRLLYSLPGPPDPAAFTAARGLIQAGTLWITGLWMQQRQQKVASSKQTDVMDTPFRDASKTRAGHTGTTVWMAGLEMGFWNFLATSLQAIGLERTTAVRSAFIIQATCILTPLLAMLAGEWPGRNVWIGCIIALISTVLITADSADPSQSAGLAGLISMGDAAVLAAAVFYSVTTVRLGYYAQQLPAISVASAKSTALAAWAVLWLITLAVRKEVAHESIAGLWEGIAQPTAWLLVFWSALGPGALAAFLQTQGQSNVPPSQAQVYYSSTPIWSALLAMLLLKGEAMGPLGWLGGVGIVVAGLLASRP